MYVESITLLTKEYNEYTVITPKVLDIVKRSGVQNGTVNGSLQSTQQQV